jgi:hypothetical protein
VRWNPHQLHLNPVLAQAPPSTVVYLHTQEGESGRNFPRQYSLDQTQAIGENKTSLWQPYNFSSEKSTKLGSENTSQTLDLISKSTHTNLMNSKARTSLNQRAIRLKNARRTIPGRHSQ